MARQGRKRDGDKERFWRDVVGRWQRRGGQSISAFCAEHDLALSSFYAWRRTIAQRDQQVMHRAASGRDEGVDNLAAFVPLCVAPAAATPALEVVVGPGRVIRVAPGFDATTLRNLLAVLEERPSC